LVINIKGFFQLQEKAVGLAFEAIIGFAIWVNIQRLTINAGAHYFTLIYVSKLLELRGSVRTM
jgi:hypothetical protein